MKASFMILAVALLVGCFIYTLYRNGFGTVNAKSALFYMSSPRWGRRKNCIEEKFSSCNGRIKRVVPLSPAKYQFVFSSRTTKGSVSVEIYGAKKDLIAKLSDEQPCACISAEKRTRLRVVTKFVTADGECKLIWTQV